MKAYAIFCSLILIAGCSKSSPSEDDAKQSILAEIGNCKYITLDSFKKENGVKQNENTYVVVADVTVTVQPIASSLETLESNEENIAKLRDKLDGATGELSDVNISIENLEKSLNLIFEDNQEKKNIREQLKERKEYRASIHGLISNLKSEISKMESVSGATLFFRECRSATTMYTNIVESENKDQFKKPFTKTYRKNILMTKTDNGWLPNN